MSGCNGIGGFRSDRQLSAIKFPVAEHVRFQLIQRLYQRLARSAHQHDENADGLRTEVFHVGMQHVDAYAVILCHLADERLKRRIALVSQLHDGADR